MASIIGEDGVDLARDRRRQPGQEIGCDAPAGVCMEFDEGEFRCPVNRGEEVQLAVRGANLRVVDMKVAERNQT